MQYCSSPNGIRCRGRSGPDLSGRSSANPWQILIIRLTLSFSSSLLIASKESLTKPRTVDVSPIFSATNAYSWSVMANTSNSGCSRSNILISWTITSTLQPNNLKPSMIKSLSCDFDRQLNFPVREGDRFRSWSIWSVAVGWQGLPSMYNSTVIPKAASALSIVLNFLLRSTSTCRRTLASENKILKVNQY